MGYMLFKGFKPNLWALSMPGAPFACEKGVHKVVPPLASVQLVNITPISLWFMAGIYIYIIYIYIYIYIYL